MKGRKYIMENNNKLLFNGILMTTFGMACLCAYPILDILGFLGTDEQRTVGKTILASYFLVLMLPGEPSIVIGISMIKAYIKNKKNNNERDKNNDKKNDN